MEQRQFGRSGLTVPCVGMGTWQTFDVPEGAASDAAEIVSEAIAVGASFFDSSPMYGRAERVLGGCLDERRPQVTVATKVWTDDDDEAAEQVANSLSYFGGFIDVYQIHNLVAWPQRLELLERLREEGKIRLIGATLSGLNGNFDRLEEVMRTGRLDAIQIPYNPLDRAVERVILPLAAELGLGVIVMRPFGGGPLVKSDPGPAALAPLKEFGIETWAQALIKWTMSETRCHVAIPATSRIGAMTENAAAADGPWLDEEARQLIVELAESSS